MLIDWTERLRRHPAVAARDGRAAPGPREQVLRRPRRHPHHAAAGPAAARRSPRWGTTTTRGTFDDMARSRRRSAAAGSTSWGRRPTARGTGTPSWPRSPSCSTRSWSLPRSRPAPTTWSSTRRNLWLTIHESIGHATELDRALGYEANYAGTSFATIDQLGTAAVRLDGHARDRRPHRRARPVATIGYDDEGVATQSWDIVRDGVLVGYQLDRPMAAPASRAQRRPLQRLRLRRLPRPHPDPADGQRVAAARARRTSRPTT